MPLVLSFLYRKALFQDSTKSENLMVNLTMLNGAIMFVGLFGTANYFARLANYFLIFQSLSLPWMLRKIGGKDGRTLTIFMILGYLAYFYYANVINQPFDQDFARLTVWQYLNQLGG
jgi:transmembrane protein EpsG